MKAGKITLDIETKVININPKDDKTKVDRNRKWSLCLTIAR